MNIIISKVGITINIRFLKKAVGPDKLNLIASI